MEMPLPHQPAGGGMTESLRSSNDLESLANDSEQAHHSSMVHRDFEIPRDETTSTGSASHHVQNNHQEPSVPTAPMMIDPSIDDTPLAGAYAPETAAAEDSLAATAIAARATAPRTKTKYRVYTEENLRLAVSAIIENGMSLRKASSAYGVPKTTLAERVAERRLPSKPTPTAAANTTGTAASGGGVCFDGTASLAIVTRRREDSGDTATASFQASQQQHQQHHPQPVVVGTHQHVPTPSTRYTWTDEEMGQAVEAVHSGGMTVADAARRFGVPPSNLNSRARGREPKSLKGEVSRLTLRQESLLAEWAGAQAALGLPASKDDVYDLAERVMQKQHGGEEGGAKKLGKQWIVHWRRRWPHVEVLDWKDTEVKLKRKRRRGDDDLNEADISVSVVPERQDGARQDHDIQQHGGQGDDVMRDEAQQKHSLTVQDELQQQLEQEVHWQPLMNVYNDVAGSTDGSTLRQD
ncbi:helix-turn-helix Psq domain-containing protein [Microdochium nivale]|nr:helix-turn-helix Psq domain-containing protein [Microdochium nivale]